MALIGDYGIDIAFLPIGDNYTMGPEDSLRAIRLIKPRLVVPMHYNTFPLFDSGGAERTTTWMATVPRARSSGAGNVIMTGRTSASIAA